MIEIQGAYQKTFLSDKSPGEIRKCLYRQLYRLKTEGYLKVEGDENSKNIIYNKTKLFEHDLVEQTDTVTNTKNIKKSLV